MLDDFKESQFVAYSLLKGAIKKNKLSHAYLIDANHYDKSFDFVLAFVKTIFCRNNHDELDGDCKLCHLIDNNNYSELKIVETDSSVIKKEMVLELQSDFSRLSLEGKYRIYIIKDCDKMNKQASNCLLKFLEEPTEGVIAILITNNVNKMLSTIISRCQIIRLNNVVSLSNVSALENFASVCCADQNGILEFINDGAKQDLINSVVDFLDYFEEFGLDIMIYLKSMWYNKFLNREDTRYGILLMLYFYYDLLKCKLGFSNYFFCDRVDIIDKCVNNNSIDNILKKIEIVNYGYEMLSYNLNLNLLLDDIIIRLGDVCECS